jgi:hypothetical protein
MTERRILPNRRQGETFELTHGAMRTRFLVTVGFFRPGQPAEVFVSGSKSGSDFEAAARDGAILLSLCLQHGVPVATMRGAVTRDGNGAPSTIIGAILDRLEQVSEKSDCN